MFHVVKSRDKGVQRPCIHRRQVIAQGKQVAVFGELHLAVLSNFSLEEPVISAEITLIDKIEYSI